MRDFWGTLCSSVKQIKAPYLFDWEQGIALHAMHGTWPSSFISQDEGMSESPVETLEKAVVVRLFWTGDFTSL